MYYKMATVVYFKLSIRTPSIEDPSYEVNLKISEIVTDGVRLIVNRYLYIIDFSENLGSIEYPSTISFQMSGYGMFDDMDNEEIMNTVTFIKSLSGNDLERIAYNQIYNLSRCINDYGLNYIKQQPSDVLGEWKQEANLYTYTTQNIEDIFGMSTGG